MKVDQVTILDSPLDPAGDQGSILRHEDFFFRALNTDHLRYVENFFATEGLIELGVPQLFGMPFLKVNTTPKFGQKIDGAGPLDGRFTGGLAFEGSDHLTILDDYADLIRGTRTDPAGSAWTSPALDGWRAPVNWKNRPNGERITGTILDDTLEGTARNDRIFGGSGDDLIAGRQGNDALSGGHGRDELHGQAGDDLMVGQRGNDQIFGSKGKDLLFGGGGRDTLVGGSQADFLFGGSGQDFLYGGKGADIFVLHSGGNQGDIIFDFGLGGDRIALLDGLGFADLRLEQNGKDLDIFIAASDRMIARLLDMTVSKLDATDVIAL